MPERTLTRGGARVRVFGDADALVATAAQELGELAHGTPERFDCVLAGGSTPEALYRRLAAAPAAVPWSRTHLWFGDERCVDPNHPDSNFGMAHRALLGPLALEPARVHRIRGELTPAAAADAYEAELRASFALSTDRWPAFDLVLLGVGEDGHTASLFPGTAALAERTRIVVANHLEALGAWRVTLSPPALDHAQRAWIFAVGARKAPIVSCVLGDVVDPARWPVQGVRPAQELVWWLDEPAAAALR